MQNPNHHYHDPTSSSPNENFLEQMLFTIQSSSPWSDLPDNPPAPHSSPPSDSTNILNNHDGRLGVGLSGYDASVLLASKLQQHQISGVPLGRVPPNGNGALLDASHFKSLPTKICDDESMQALHNVFNAGSQHHFFPPQPPTFEVLNHQQPPQLQTQPHAHQVQPQASGSSSGGTAPAQQTKPRVRARRGQATDPHSIAERVRRERIAERMKSLQELVPNANKTDKASMLDEIIDYVKFLQLQVKVLSMSRLGGAAAVAPLVADMSSEGGSTVGECQGNGTIERSSNQTPSSGENISVTEHQVAKLMEEDMGSAMQFLQGKGLCLMPISLATAISTATCQSRASSLPVAGNGRPPRQPDGESSLVIPDGAPKDTVSSK